MDYMESKCSYGDLCVLQHPTPPSQPIPSGSSAPSQPIYSNPSSTYSNPQQIYNNPQQVFFSQPFPYHPTTPILYPTPAQLSSSSYPVRARDPASASDARQSAWRTPWRTSRSPCTKDTAPTGPPVCRSTAPGTWTRNDVRGTAQPGSGQARNPAAGLLVDNGQKKKKYRRGRGRNKNNVDFSLNDNKLILYHLNIRGINSKKSSLQKMLNKVNANIVRGREQ